MQFKPLSHQAELPRREIPPQQLPGCNFDAGLVLAVPSVEVAPLLLVELAARLISLGIALLNRYRPR
jgi:hypothetical protein